MDDKIHDSVESITLIKGKDDPYTHCIFCNRLVYRNKKQIRDLIKNKTKNKITSKFINKYWKSYEKNIQISEHLHKGVRISNRELSIKLFKNHGILLLNNKAHICNECNNNDLTKKINSDNRLECNISPYSSTILSMFHMILNRRTPFSDNISGFERNILFPKKGEKIKNCINIKLLSNTDTIKYCRISKLALRYICKKAGISLIKGFCFCYFWGHDISYELIGQHIGKSEVTVRRYIDEATDKLYHNWAVKYFNKIISREYIKKHTTDFSRVVLEIPDPEACIAVIDGFSIETETPGQYFYSNFKYLY